jgi:membrane protein DedA with SNARE-associated domain
LAAGAARYTYKRFLVWNVLGALLWGAGLTVAGSLLGGIRFIADNVDVLALVIVAASLIPVGVGFLRRRVPEVSKDAGSESKTPGSERDCTLRIREDI